MLIVSVEFSALVERLWKEHKAKKAAEALAASEEEEAFVAQMRGMGISEEGDSLVALLRKMNLSSEK